MAWKQFIDQRGTADKGIERKLVQKEVRIIEKDPKIVRAVGTKTHTRKLGEFGSSKAAKNDLDRHMVDRAKQIAVSPQISM